MSSLDKWLKNLSDSYTSVNPAGSLLAKGLRILGVGLMPVADHWLLRVQNPEAGAYACQQFDYREEGVFDLPHSFLRVFVRQSFPDILIQIPKPSKMAGAGKSAAPSAALAGAFETHHLGVRVSDLDEAVFYLEKQGIAFRHEKNGDQTKGFRFAFAENPAGSEPQTQLAVIERTQGFSGYLSEYVERLDWIKTAVNLSGK